MERVLIPNLGKTRSTTWKKTDIVDFWQNANWSWVVHVFYNCCVCWELNGSSVILWKVTSNSIYTKSQAYVRMCMHKNIYIQAHTHTHMWTTINNTDKKIYRAGTWESLTQTQTAYFQNCEKQKTIEMNKRDIKCTTKNKFRLL